MLTNMTIRQRSSFNHYTVAVNKTRQFGWFVLVLHVGFIIIIIGIILTCVI